MKLNRLERLLVNSPLRAFSQRHIEGPLLSRMSARRRYPLCLEIGCGRGIGAEVIDLIAVKRFNEIAVLGVGRKR